MPIRLGHRRMALVHRNQSSRRYVPVQALSGQKFAPRSIKVMRDKRERRQSQMSTDVIGGADRVIQIIEQEREPNACRKRNKKGDKYVPGALRTGRCAGCDRVVLDLDIIRATAGKRQFLLFLTLNIGIKKAAVRFELTLFPDQLCLGDALDI